MPKKIKEEEKNIEDKQQSIEEEIIDKFIMRKESDAAGSRNLYSFPVMMRLNVNHMARLEHLAKKWRIKKSSLARQMLEEMIYLVMDRYYKDKTQEEYFLIQRQAYDEFNKKIEKMIKKKESK